MFIRSDVTRNIIEGFAEQKTLNDQQLKKNEMGFCMCCILIIKYSLARSEKSQIRKNSSHLSAMANEE